MLPALILGALLLFGLPLLFAGHGGTDTGTNYQVARSFGALSGFVFDFVFGFVFGIGLEALAKEFLFVSVLDTIVKTLMGRTPGVRIYVYL